MTSSGAPDSDPAALLEQAWALEPLMRLTERTAILDRIDALASNGQLPPNRDWRAEVLAERAIDAARLNELDRGRELAEQVLQSGTTSDIALARATEAAGRSLAWVGTDAATRRADRLFGDALDRYRALGATEWVGFLKFWRANTIRLQTGELDEALAGLADALTDLRPDSTRRTAVLSFYADALISVGDWDAADQMLAEADELADRDDDTKSRAYLAWSRARLASVRLDAMATERHLREAERESGDWFRMQTGVTFLADAAEQLDRVGLAHEASEYLRRAQQRDPDDEFVRQAEATLLARRGDPEKALSALQELARGNWLEKRWLWRHTLWSAWATFRAGRDGAATLAARAFDQAERSGGIRVALASEPELARSLLPLAALAGSDVARRALLGQRRFIVRLLGATEVISLDGDRVELPVGRPAELVRLLAVNPYGLTVEQVAEEFFPDVPVATSRNRLRQLLSRIRASAGELILRDQDRLLLAPAWVDVAEFLVAADRVRGTSGARSVQLAYTALVLWGGPPLPYDTYADWAGQVRDRLEQRHLSLLDVVLADAERRGSHHEAVTALTGALEYSPYQHERYYVLAEHLLALGRHATAHYLAKLAGVDLAAGDGLTAN